MLAIPLDESSSTQISKLYGNAPYFALLNVESGDFTVVENEVKGSGPKSAGFLKSKGADATIYYHMGEGVYKAFSKEGMGVYTVKQRIESLDEILTKFKAEGYTEVNDGNYKELLIPGDSGESCKCGCNND